jgi:pyruvate dehydrogenase E1 component
MRRPDVRAVDVTRTQAGRGELTLDADPDTSGDVAVTAPAAALGASAPSGPHMPGAQAPDPPAPTPRAPGPQTSSPQAPSPPAPSPRPPVPRGAVPRGAESHPDGSAPNGAVAPSVDHTLPPPVPGPPGGILDLEALATLDDRLRAVAGAIIDEGTRSGRRSPTDTARDRAGVASASSVATVLWFDALRAEDRVSVTPHAAPLVLAVHHLLEDARAATEEAVLAGPRTAPLPSPGDRPVRLLGAGNVGPSGTVWSALARRYAGHRFDEAPRGRQICLIDFAELRDPAVWETITDERVSHLGELFWVVLVAGAGVSRGAAPWPGSPPGPATMNGAGPRDGSAGTDSRGGPGEFGSVGGPGGIGGPGRAARLFEAAGWQVLTVRHGRRLGALLRAPGGPALGTRLDRLTGAEYRELLHLRGRELRRRLAGPGAAGAGISRLLDTMTDDEILACLRDLGGHDIPLLIDAFDEVAADRPTVLFAYTGDDLPAPAGHGPPGEDVRAPAEIDDGLVVTAEVLARRADLAPRPAGTDPAGTHQAGNSPAGNSLAPLAWSSGARRLARHVAAYLDRAPTAPRDPAPVPAHTDRAFPLWISTQDAFGLLLRDLPALAPASAAAVVTISTRAADPVLAGWLAADATPDAARPSPALAGNDDAPAAHPDPAAHPGPAGGSAMGGGEQASRRHVAGGLSAAAFGGVLGSLGVAWSRQGLPLLPIGVADEISAGRMLAGWLAAGATDARSLLAVADTGLDAASRALAFNGGDGVPATVAATWIPAFADDLAWCLLAGLGRLARLDGASSLVHLSARPVDQRLAELPADPQARRRRQALALAGGYRLHEGGPAAAITLVGVGPVMTEVQLAAARLRAGLGRDVSVVCLTSPNAVFQALQARRGLAEGSDALLAELFPADRRTPLVTVVDGDPRVLSFLAAVHGDLISALGSAAPPPGAPPPSPAAGPVPTELIIGTALDLLDEAASR